jgi:hypothetical protein
MGGAARSCGVCGAVLTGRADALYCSSACRQKAHRARHAGPRPQQADTAALIAQARAAQRESRKFRRVLVQRRQALVGAVQQLARTRQGLVLR